MADVKGSFASPSADASMSSLSPGASGLLMTIYNGTTAWGAVLALVFMLIAYDQIAYIWRKGSITGPRFKLPFMGPFLESVNPKFEQYKAKWESGELSCVSVFHKFVIIAGTRDMARKVFNSPAYVKPCVVDSAHKLLGKTNWVFLDGKDHVDFRKGLNGLFTRSALAIYIPRIDAVFDKYFKVFCAESKKNDHKPLPMMPYFRELMCAVSCQTFVGSYISEETIKKIADDYYLITAALELVNFPIILPFTKTWYGKKAADMVMVEFSKCAAKSKVRMAAGGEVTCIMDGWIQSIIKSSRYREKLAKGLPVDDSDKPQHMLREFTDYEIAQTVFTFLFASQDATSSASTWLWQLMANRPDILDRVREENLSVRNGDRNVPIDMDLAEKLTYTKAVVKETLRYRPPVIMVPYLAKKDWPITPDYTVPKGAMIIPTLWSATHDPDVYDNPDSFDPDRWITGTAEQHPKNFLVFGTGPHYCLGQTYAQLALACMIGKASMMLDWEHHATPVSEDIKVFATIFPQDDSPRKQCLHPSRTRAQSTAALPCLQARVPHGISQRLHYGSKFPVAARTRPFSLSSPVSSAQNDVKQYTFEDINSSLSSPSSKPIILVDVREPAELQATGTIPTSVCIPIASQPDAYFLTPDEFLTRFGFPKPGLEGGAEESDLVFFCKAGVRARTAAQLAVQAGYDAARIGVYDGSWLDWDKKGGKAEKWDGPDV
ncbi:RNA polymerase C-22 sterol desaturase [Myotisia sp. PD_48]|nr:RNA polymerase C-22 sterol desaturase [Myotisia sp. PD_48]